LENDCGLPAEEVQSAGLFRRSDRFLRFEQIAGRFSVIGEESALIINVSGRLQLNTRGSAGKVSVIPSRARNLWFQCNQTGYKRDSSLGSE
jgi:hypothetical protein